MRVSSPRLFGSLPAGSRGELHGVAAFDAADKTVSVRTLKTTPSAGSVFSFTGRVVGNSFPERLKSDDCRYPIVGTETYISFVDANAVAADRLNASEWRAAVEAEEGESIPTICRQALITAAATLSRMPWVSELSLPMQPESIPAGLAKACAELAFYLLTSESRRRRGVQMQMIGQSLETYFPEVADDLPKHVRRLIEPLLRVQSTHCAELVP